MLCSYAASAGQLKLSGEWKNEMNEELLVTRTIFHFIPGLLEQASLMLVRTSPLCANSEMHIEFVSENELSPKLSRKLFQFEIRVDRNPHPQSDLSKLYSTTWK